MPSALSAAHQFLYSRLVTGSPSWGAQVHLSPAGEITADYFVTFLQVGSMPIKGAGDEEIGAVLTYLVTAHGKDGDRSIAQLDTAAAEIATLLLTGDTVVTVDSHSVWCVKDRRGDFVAPAETKEGVTYRRHGGYYKLTVQFP
jgi:hypothetical protein